MDDDPRPSSGIPEPVTSRPAARAEPDPDQARLLLRLLLETVTLLEADGTVRWINLDDAGGILGYAPGVFAGQTLFDLFHPDDAPRLAALWEELLATPGAVVQAHGRLRAADGSYQDAEGIAYNLLDDPTIRAVVVCTRNITRHRMAAEAGADAEALRDLLEQATDLALLYDRSGHLRCSSRSTESALGWSAQDVATLDGFLDRVHADDRTDIERRIATVRGYPYRTITTDARLRHRHGTYLDVELRIGTPRLADELGGVALTGIDVTDARARERVLEHRSLHDPLTDLPNRVLLADRLEQACRRLTRGGQVVVAYVDVDHFKLVNDRFGHRAGDDVLVEVARRLRGALRPEDTVARLAGDEFVAVAVVDAADLAPATVAHRLFGAVVDEPIAVEAAELNLTVSIGVATASRATADPRALLEAADAAMYRAKRAGRARIERADTLA